MLLRLSTLLAVSTTTSPSTRLLKELGGGEDISFNDGK
jgi:hypothetical protein